MALQVAPCPRCRGAIVFGERQCRACGQSFDYGASAPPLPTPHDVWQALGAVGQIPPDPTAQRALAQSIQDSLARFSSPPGAPAQTASEPSVARIADLDTGRFTSPDTVPIDDVPGLIDSSLFAALTPKEVRVETIPGLEQTASARVGNVAAIPSVEVERAAAPVGEVQVQRVPELFHSDFLRAPDGVPTQRLDVIESSPSAYIERKKPVARGKKANKAVELDRVVCRCGESHRLDHCPSCGTAHPGSA